MPFQFQGSGPGASGVQGLSADLDFEGYRARPYAGFRFRGFRIQGFRRSRSFRVQGWVWKFSGPPVDKGSLELLQSLRGPLSTKTQYAGLLTVP